MIMFIAQLFYKNREKMLKTMFSGRSETDKINQFFLMWKLHIKKI